MNFNSSIYPDFPQNISLNVFVTSHHKSNEILTFILNINVKELEKKENYNVEFIGKYNEITKEFQVSQKCRNIFIKEFIFNGKILVPNLFQKYILPELQKFVK